MPPKREIDWPAAAAALAAAFSPARWPEAVRAWRALPEADGPWAVAFSGGADSLALLLALEGTPPAERETGNGSRPGGEPGSGGWRGARGTPLVALHFNHRLRGAAADADEAFCREVSAALGIGFAAGAADWAPGSAVSEAEARAARFGFFAAAMQAAGARSLLLGHHRDDGVETMLLRLSRGSGARGLAAPRPVQRMGDGTVRVRPWLDVPKAEIVAALRLAGVPWCDDASNHGEAYFRNRLRHTVVPGWAAAAAPVDLAEAVARSRALLEEEDAALEAWTDRVLPADLVGPLPLAPVREAPVAVGRRALQRWLGAQQLGESLSRVAFEDLLATVRSGETPTRRSAGAGVFLVVGPTELAVAVDWPAAEPEWAGTTLAVPGSVELPDGGRLQAQVVALDPARRARIRGGEWDDGRTAFLGFALQPPAVLRVRTWREGDRYTALGSTHATKLQDQFVNRRIPRAQRRRLPVVVGEAEAIWWVPGLPPADPVRIEDGSPVAVQLTYHPANSLSPCSPWPITTLPNAVR